MSKISQNFASILLYEMTKDRIGERTAWTHVYGEINFIGSHYRLSSPIFTYST